MIPSSFYCLLPLYLNRTAAARTGTANFSNPSFLPPVIVKIVQPDSFNVRLKSGGMYEKTGFGSGSTIPLLL
jgi:hypothetical protein